MSTFTQPSLLKQGVATVAQVWTPFDPHAASQWAASAGSPEVRSTAISAVAGHWVQRDAAAAVGWLESLPSVDVPDEAWRNVAQNIVTRKPGDALQYALRIKNATAREELVVRLASFWLGENHTDADNWLAASDISPELREKIRVVSEARPGLPGRMP